MVFNGRKSAYALSLKLVMCVPSFGLLLIAIRKHLIGVITITTGLHQAKYHAANAQRFLNELHTFLTNEKS